MEGVEQRCQEVGMKFPMYITCTEVAKILEWDTARTRRWLIGSGVAVKRGSRWVTTPELLRRGFPELWEEFMSGRYGDEDE